MRELTDLELAQVAGGALENHGQITSSDVHSAQDFAKSNGLQVGPVVSAAAHGRRVLSD